MWMVIMCFKQTISIWGGDKLLIRKISVFAANCCCLIRLFFVIHLSKYAWFISQCKDKKVFLVEFLINYLHIWILYNLLICWIQSLWWLIWIMAGMVVPWTLPFFQIRKMLTWRGSVNECNRFQTQLAKSFHFLMIYSCANGHCLLWE